MLIALLLIILSSHANASDDPFRSLLALTGIESIVNGLNVDMRDAAKRHAQRCNSSQLEVLLRPGTVMSELTADIKRSVLLTEVLHLEEWYKSTTGRKVILLEQRVISEKEMQQFQASVDRAEQVSRIYNNTGAGALSAAIASEIEYAGWLASGCMDKARHGGDTQQIDAERIYGELLKGQGDTLETLFRKNTLDVMEFVFSPLSDVELIEYADITKRSKAVYTILIESLQLVIQREVQQQIGLP